MLSGFIQLSPFDVLQTYSAATVQDTPSTIGGLGITSDGRKFRLGFNNTVSTTLAACKINQGPAVVSALEGGTVSVQAIGDTQITYTFNGGATSVTANQLAGGFIAIVTGTGAVAQYQIKGHGAVTSKTTVLLNLVDPIIIATAVTDTANIWAQPYSAVIVMPGSAATGSIVGVNMVAIPAQYYGWFQTGGTSTCLNQGGTTAGLGLAVGSVAGSLATIGATTAQIAVAVQTGVDTAYTFVKMTLE